MTGMFSLTKDRVKKALGDIFRLPDGTVASDDFLVINDVSDGNKAKKVTAQSVADLSSGLLALQVFTSSGTWTPTAGTNAVKVTVVGGGGGGYGNSTNGTVGGTSSFGAFCSAGGGNGGSNSSEGGGGGGTATGGDINIPGGGGGKFGSGASTMGGNPLGGAAPTGPYGAGGTPGGSGGGYGGAGATAIKWITSGLGSSQTVTVGAAGARGGGGDTPEAGSGVAGVVIVEEYS